MAERDIKNVVREAFANFNESDNRSAFFKSYDRDVVVHGYPTGLDGLEGLERFHAELWDAFPDAQLSLEDMLVDGDRAALRYRLRGTHRGSYLGVAATGIEIDVEGLMMLRLGDDRVIEEWHSPTELSILRRLGAVETKVALSATEPRRPPRHSAAAEAAALRWEEGHPE
jgi:predicted ester cyclase